MMNNKSLLILEIVWIVTALLCVAAGIRIFMISGYENRILLLALMTIISLVFALARHRQRKKL